MGIRHLPTFHWQTNYALSLELYSTAAEAEFCIGNFESMQLYCNQVLAQEGRPLLDKRRVYDVLIDYTSAEKGMAAAFTLCQCVLAKLRCHFPKRMIQLHVLWELARLMPTLKRYAQSDLMLSLRPTEDDEMRWLTTLLDKFTTFVYLTKPALLPLVVFKGFRIALNHGIRDYTPCVLAFLGLMLVAFVQDYRGGQAFADQAIELLSKVRNSGKVEARVMHVAQVLVLHWQRPLKLCIKPLLSGYDGGMSMGNTGSAAWCVYFYLEHSFRTGVSLIKVKAECEFYADRLRDVKQLALLQILSNLWQAVRHLTGDDSYCGPLKGAVVDQDEVLQDVARGGSVYSLNAVYRMQMYVAFVFGMHDEVYQSRLKTKMHEGHYETIFRGIAGIYFLYACNGLSMTSLYRQTQDPKYLQLAKRFASKIKRWVKAGVRRFC